MRRLFFAFFICHISLHLCISASEFRLQGGSLDLNGILEVENARTASGTTLTGNGIHKGNLQVSGSVQPGTRTSNSVGHITVTSMLEFQSPGTFDCYANTHTNIDRITVYDTASGTCAVHVTASAAAIPLDQIIIHGGSNCIYTAFTPSPGSAWELTTLNTNDLALTDLLGDTDGDTIPDYWENDFYHGRTNADANADSDSDGASSRDEYISGTDPTNQTSVLAMNITPQANTNEVVVSWSSVSGKQYTLWTFTNMLSSSYSLVESNISATIPETSYTNIISSFDRRYYRVEVEQ